MKIYNFKREQMKSFCAKYWTEINENIVFCPVYGTKNITLNYEKQNNQSTQTEYNQQKQQQNTYYNQNSQQIYEQANQQNDMNILQLVCNNQDYFAKEFQKIENGKTSV